MNESITVETDLFEHREVKPHFINPCCFGEDFAAWLKQELLRFPEVGVELSEPIQEDYGWGLWASHSHDRFWIAISFVGDGPQEAPAQWILSVTYDPGFNLAKRLFHKPDQQALAELRDRVRQILQSNNGIKQLTSETIRMRSSVGATGGMLSEQSRKRSPCEAQGYDFPNSLHQRIELLCLRMATPQSGNCGDIVSILVALD